MEQEFDKEKIFVFLGPSLLISEAKAILPNAYYLPPARCGDILRILRFKPSIIALIDGYFENTPAVWHKEILLALEKGVTVIGGSSMGALRVSELHCYGMLAVGKIAESYINNLIIEDDCVAILHAPEQSGYQAITDALVNIQATLENALSSNIIDKCTYAIIYESAKKLYYPKRMLHDAIKAASEKGASIQQLAQLNHWLNDNYVDLKREDAILLLRTIANKTFNKPPVCEVKVNKSAFFRALQKNVMCRPFTSYHDWLPIQEKVAFVARYLGTTYRLTRRLAYLLAACHSLAIQQKISLAGFDEHKLFEDNSFGLGVSAKNSSWEKKYDCNLQDKIQFFSRLAKIRLLLDKEAQITNINNKVEDYLLILIRVSNDYQTYKDKIIKKPNFNKELEIINCLKVTDPIKFQLIKSIAYCWWLIERLSLRIGIQPNDKSIQEYSDRFRMQRGLHTQKATEEWLTKNDLTLNDYVYLITALTRLSFLVMQNNLDILGIFENTGEVWWLLDALRLSGVYNEAKKLLYNSQNLLLLQQKAKEQPLRLQQYAYSLDFIGGEQEFMKSPVYLEKLNLSSVAFSTMDS